MQQVEIEGLGDGHPVHGVVLVVAGAHAAAVDVFGADFAAGHHLADVGANGGVHAVAAGVDDQNLALAVLHAVIQDGHDVAHAQVGQGVAAGLQGVPEGLVIVEQAVHVVAQAVLCQPAVLLHGLQKHRPVGAVVAASAGAAGEVRQLVGIDLFARGPVDQVAHGEDAAARVVQVVVGFAGNARVAIIGGPLRAALVQQPQLATLIVEHFRLSGVFHSNLPFVSRKLGCIRTAGYTGPCTAGFA